MAKDGTTEVRPWRDLREWLEVCRQQGELRTFSSEVDTDEELAAITFLAARNKSEAYLFENPKGVGMPSRVLSNMLGASAKRYALAVGLDPSLSTRELIAATRRLLKKRVPPREVQPDDAPVFENSFTGDNINLLNYPAPKFWPGDGGRFFGTGNVTFIRNPDSGLVNAGVYRQMLHGPKTIGINMVPGRHGIRNCHKWWERGEPCPVLVAYGTDPAMFMAATQAYKQSESELDGAGGLIGAPVEVTRGRFVDLPIPARAEFVIEGFIHADRQEVEGPLGEFHGFYSGAAAPKPVIDVKAIHHRTNPILTAALMANYPSGEIGAYHAIMRSARICDTLEDLGLQGIVSAYAHPGSASGYGFVAVSIKQTYPGHAAQVLALTAQMPAAAYCTKYIVVVDDDVDPTDIDDVLWAMTTMANPADDIDVLRQTWTFRSDPSLQPEDRPYGSKALINACRPHNQLGKPPHRAYLRREIYDRVVSRWAELGLDGVPPHIDRFHCGN
ncbi:MAG: UbiD family decarboxylase [Proteobacteria bacterium]|nr:UbiD family decarboxylase [Pseudomonadota bacterium]